jgi:hypothetical protein
VPENLVLSGDALLAIVRSISVSVAFGALGGPPGARSPASKLPSGAGSRNQLGRSSSRRCAPIAECPQLGHPEKHMAQREPDQRTINAN